MHYIYQARQTLNRRNSRLHRELQQSELTRQKLPPVRHVVVAGGRGGDVGNDPVVVQYAVYVDPPSEHIVVLIQSATPLTRTLTAGVLRRPQPSPNDTKATIVLVSGINNGPPESPLWKNVIKKEY